MVPVNEDRMSIRTRPIAAAAAVAWSAFSADDALSVSEFLSEGYEPYCLRT